MISKVVALNEDNKFEYSYLRDKDVVKFFKNPFLSGKRVAIDIETYPRKKYENDTDGALLPEKAKIRTLQMFDGVSCVVLDFMNSDGSYTLLNPWITEQLQKFLLSKILIAHNALFETSHLQKLFAAFYDKVKPLNIRCTMNAYRLITHATTQNPLEFKAGLDVVSKMVIGVNLPKDEQSSDWSAITLSDSQIRYCALDAIVPYFIMQSLAETISELCMEDVYLLNTEAQEALAHMRIYGIGFNKKEHFELTKEWRKHKEALEIKCLTLLNRDKEDISDEEYEDILLAKVVRTHRERIIRQCNCSLGKGRDVTSI